MRERVKLVRAMCVHIFGNFNYCYSFLFCLVCHGPAPRTIQLITVTHARIFPHCRVLSLSSHPLLLTAGRIPSIPFVLVYEHGNAHKISCSNGGCEHARQPDLQISSIRFRVFAVSVWTPIKSCRRQGKSCRRGRRKGLRILQSATTPSNTH